MANARICQLFTPMRPNQPIKAFFEVEIERAPGHWHRESEGKTTFHTAEEAERWVRENGHSLVD